MYSDSDWQHKRKHSKYKGENEKLFALVLVLPSTKMTGTEGGSNLIFPVLAIGKLSLVGVFTISNLLPPLRSFHSASSESGAVEFASKLTNEKYA